MPKFFSIAGMSPTGGEGKQGALGFTGRKLMDRNPRASEYYKQRDENRDTSTGHTPGDECMYGGEHAEVLHEEFNQHTKEVETTVRANSQSGSGTYRTKWKQEKPGKLVVTESKRIFE